MAFIQTGGSGSLYYEDSGLGNPLVLIHGWAMSSRVWGFQRELADSCRLIAVDMRGHGRSSAPSEEFGLNELAEDLHLIFDRLSLDNAVLVGWSLGSLVALRAFASLRDRLAALVLVGGTPRFTRSDDYDGGLPLREVRGLDARLKRNYAVTMGEFFRRMFVQGELSRAQENLIARQIVMGSALPDPVVAQAGLDILAREDLRHLVPKVDRPVLLLHGEQDAICPPAAARYLEAHLPLARLTLLPATGHAPFLSRPREFNSLLRDYLREIHGRN